MSLVDEARAKQRPRGNVCAMQQLKKTDPNLYAETLEAIASDISCRAISEALADPPHEIVISRQVIENHRNNLCAGCKR